MSIIHCQNDILLITLWNNSKLIHLNVFKYWYVSLTIHLTVVFLPIFVFLILNFQFVTFFALSYIPQVHKLLNLHSSQYWWALKPFSFNMSISSHVFTTSCTVIKFFSLRSFSELIPCSLKKSGDEYKGYQVFIQLVKCLLYSLFQRVIFWDPPFLLLSFISIWWYLLLIFPDIQHFIFLWVSWFFTFLVSSILSVVSRFPWHCKCGTFSHPEFYSNILVIDSLFTH